MAYAAPLVHRCGRPQLRKLSLEQTPLFSIPLYFLFLLFTIDINKSTSQLSLLRFGPDTECKSVGRGYSQDLVNLTVIWRTLRPCPMVTSRRSLAGQGAAISSATNTRRTSSQPNAPMPIAHAIKVKASRPLYVRTIARKRHSHSTITMARSKRTSTRNSEDDQSTFDDNGNPLDIVTSAILPAYHFRDEDFAQRNLVAVAEYAGYRALGVNAERAFLRTFGTDYADPHLTSRIEALEHNVIYRRAFLEAFSKVKVGEMWDVKMAAWEYLQLVNNPFVKDSTRLSAIKELNVLFGITVVDDTGRTRAGRGLKEFYADTIDAEAGSVTQATSAPARRHPDPGSADAEARIEARKAEKDAARTH